MHSKTHRWVAGDQFGLLAFGQRGGEGIGLAITSQVMKAHGGSAQAANAPGGGLEVRLSLPESAAA